jgi:ABC-2 type transport system permease protein
VIALLRIEFGKLVRLSSVRFSLLLLLVLPLLWAYAPGVFRAYGVFLVSGFQVPSLGLLAGIEVLLPLLVAITAAELLGLEMSHGTLATILLRPVSRSHWLLAKLLVSLVYPFALLLFLLVVSLAAGSYLGFGPFVGGTGFGETGILGMGTMQPGDALVEVLRAYLVAALSLVPICMLAVLLTVLFMNSAAGALATLGVLVVTKLLVVFPSIEPYLLTSLLSAQLAGGLVAAGEIGRMVLLTLLYGVAFAVAAVVLFERKDF